MDGYLAEIRLFGGTFAPLGWEFCWGQLLQIRQSQYTQALFSLFSTTYGGDGLTTFALPDLRSRIVINAGQGVNLPFYKIGQKIGSESTDLVANNFPNHTHTIACNNTTQNANTPAGNFPAIGRSLGSPPRTTPVDRIYAVTTDLNTMNDQMVMPAGTSDTLTPMSVIQPVLGMNYIICVEGNYPLPPDAEAQT